MQWDKPLEKAIFKERLNRFVAMVEIAGNSQLVHVVNTGRLKELLIPGAEVWLQKSPNEKRRYAYDLELVQHNGMLVCIDSGIPNKLAAEYLPTLFPDAKIRPEYTRGNSRFDFCVEQDGKTTYVEVKGVTLELSEGLAAFPDAPTVRGAKHLRELAELKREGYGAMALFVIQRKGIRAFRPYAENDPKFAEAYREAVTAGVVIKAVDCLVTGAGTHIDAEVGLVPVDEW